MKRFTSAFAPTSIIYENILKHAITFDEMRTAVSQLHVCTLFSTPLTVKSEGSKTLNAVTLAKLASNIVYKGRKVSPQKIQPAQAHIKSPHLERDASGYHRPVRTWQTLDLDSFFSCRSYQ